ncbi:MAG: hypothetical protein MZW92_05895 [Comamonadaceae bacterium]|nr:hypothetical protein [Comamonadaceae bacterium]
MEGQRNLVASCVFPVAEGMIVKTTTERVAQGPQAQCRAAPVQPPHGLQRLHPQRQLRAPGGGRGGGLARASVSITRVTKEKHDRQLQPLHRPRRAQVHQVLPLRDRVRRDPDRLCPAACPPGRQGFIGRPAFDMPLIETNCTMCGQCVAGLPGGRALREGRYRSGLGRPAGPRPNTWSSRRPRPSAPPWARSLGMPAGIAGHRQDDHRAAGGWASTRCSTPTSPPTSPSSRKATSCCKRVKEGGNAAHDHLAARRAGSSSASTSIPDLLDNLSTCKSPQQMFGRAHQDLLRPAAGIDPKDIVSVSIMPCTAKKFECQRDRR